jgi:hypothetical protein
LKTSWMNWFTLVQSCLIFPLPFCSRPQQHHLGLVSGALGRVLEMKAGC